MVGEFDAAGAKSHASPPGTLYFLALLLLNITTLLLVVLPDTIIGKGALTFFVNVNDACVYHGLSAAS